MHAIRNLEEVLSKKLGPDKKISNVEVTTPPPKGVGSIMFKVKVTVQGENDQTQLLHLVAKTIPKSDSLKEAFDIQRTFKKEVAFYEVILPTLWKFQKEQGITDILDNFAEFFGARTNLHGNNDVVDEDAVILLEDVSVKGEAYLCLNRET